MTIGELQRSIGTLLGQAGIVGAVDDEDCARTGLERFRDSAPHHRHLALCKYNITFGRRFADVATFKKIIENRERNKDDGRPLALLLYNKYDPKGAYESDAGDIRKLTERYRVMYYEVPTLREASAAVLDGTKDMKASKVALAGHGDSISIQLSKYNFITADDGDFFQTLGDRIVRGADIFLPSCSTGQELAAVVSRYIPHAKVHALHNDGNSRLRFAPDDRILGFLGLNTSISIWKGGRKVYKGNGCPADYPHIARIMSSGSLACYDPISSKLDPAGVVPKSRPTIGKVIGKMLFAPFYLIKKCFEVGIGTALKEEGIAALMASVAYAFLGIAIYYMIWLMRGGDDGRDKGGDGYSINDDCSVDIWKRGWVFRKLKYTLTGFESKIFRIIEKTSDASLGCDEVETILWNEEYYVPHLSSWRYQAEYKDWRCKIDRGLHHLYYNHVLDRRSGKYTVKSGLKNLTDRPAPWHWRVGTGIRTLFRLSPRLGR